MSTLNVEPDLEVIAEVADDHEIIRVANKVKLQHHPTHYCASPQAEIHPKSIQDVCSLSNSMLKWGLHSSIMKGEG